MHDDPATAVTVHDARNVVTDAVREFTGRLGFASAVALLDDRDFGVFSIVGASGLCEPHAREAAAYFRLRAKDAGTAALASGGTITMGDAPPAISALLRALHAPAVESLPLRDADGLLGFVLVAPASRAARSEVDALLNETMVALRFAILCRLRTEERTMLMNQQAEIDVLVAEIEQRDALRHEELLHAQDFQRLMLARDVRVPGYAVETAYRPLDVVSGDLYDVARIGEVLRIFIADTTGHGVRAALATMVVRAEYEGVKGEGSPSEVLSRLNGRIVEAYGIDTLIMTAACIDIAIASGEMSVASAAHPAAILVGGGTTKELGTGGSLLGIVPQPEIATSSSNMPEGGGLYLYTDGLSEGMSSTGELFGEKRILEALGGGHGVREVLDELDAFVRPASIQDDLTIVGVRRLL